MSTGVAQGFDPAAIAAALDAGEAELLGDDMRTTILDHGARTARVVVLVHGLTASPRTWRDFARVRHARGDNVLIARLPRHGHADRATETLAQLTSEELTRQTERIVDAAAALGAEITMLGHSLGGMLTLHAAHRDARIFRAIAVAPLSLKPSSITTKEFSTPIWTSTKTLSSCSRTAAPRATPAWRKSAIWGCLPSCLPKASPIWSASPTPA